MISDFILLFCSGLTFAVGSINLAIGSIWVKDRSYLFFGLISLFASVYLILQVYQKSDFVTINSADIISIIVAVIFYTLFLWFIGEFTGYKRTVIQIIISLFAILLIPLYILVKKDLVSWQFWELMSHLTILMISIYGIIAGIKGVAGKDNVWKIIYLLLIILLFLTTIIWGINTIFNVTILLDPAKYLSPLDFFPVFFSLIIGSKMSHDIVRSYQLDKELNAREKKWSSLMDKINLLVIEYNLNGKITYVNSYFSSFSGYTSHEVYGMYWNRSLLDIEEDSTKANTFLDIISGKEIPSHQNRIRTKSGEIKDVQWANLLLKNADGQLAGFLSIGTNVTERETAITEIIQLKSQLEKENLLLREEIQGLELGGNIIGESDSLKYALKRASQVSGTDSTVLLEGETGVGKELFADLIHRKSKRTHRPFIKVNCSAIPRELIESEFFGHEKGSFTGAIKSRQGRFELADKGTIFLDEVGEIPFELQSKLLRVLQSGEFERVGSEVTKKVEVRIIAATNRNLNKESQEGLFRQDLFYRLNVYPITIPPLRQRKDDIPTLVSHFVDNIGRKMGKKIKNISKEDLAKLQNYNWPGNVRELENVIERAIINSSHDTLRIDDEQLRSQFHFDGDISGISEDLKLSDTQKAHIKKVLEECNWKINGENGAAKALGIPPSTLRSKMKKLNIVRPD